MLHVLIQYHPIGGNAYFKVNGEPLQASSRLAKYSREPIARWAGQLVPLLVGERNEENLEISFCGSPMHYALLAEALKEAGRQQPEIVVNLSHRPFDPHLERRDELAAAALEAARLLEQSEFAFGEESYGNLVGLLRESARRSEPEAAVGRWNDECLKLLSALDRRAEALVGTRTDLSKLYKYDQLVAEDHSQHAAIKNAFRQIGELKEKWETLRKDVNWKLEAAEIGTDLSSETIRLCAKAQFYQLYLDIERFVALDIKPAIQAICDSFLASGLSGPGGQDQSAKEWINGIFGGAEQAVRLFSSVDAVDWKGCLIAAVGQASGVAEAGIKYADRYINENRSVLQERINDQRLMKAELRQKGDAVTRSLADLHARQQILLKAQAIIRNKLEALQ